MIATISVVVRTFVRYQLLQKLYIEDVLVHFAWLMSLAFTVSWQILADDLYLQTHVVTFGRPPPRDFAARTERYLKGVAALLILYLISLWLIKASFLILFRRLFTHFRKWMRFWWGVAAFTFASLPISIGTGDINCLVKPLTKIVLHCNEKGDIEHQRASLVAVCVLDVGSDLLSTSSPLTANTCDPAN